jgi:hypothetical protein
MALITVSDITTYMDITLTNVQEDAAQFVIDGLQAELEAYLRRPIEQTEFTESYRIPDYGRGVNNNQYYYNYATDPATTLTGPGIVYTPMYTLYLENSPVISVSSISITPASPTGSTTVQVAERDYITRDFGVELFNAFANDRVSITYTAGLDGANIKAFKLLLLRAATREMQNMHDDVVGLKDLTTRNVAPLETGFSERELMSIKRYRRVRVA